jgi:hypothetical protein
LTFNATPDWSFQVSAGNLEAPEQLEPDVDVLRTTASAIYNRAWEEDNWQTTLAAGRNDKDPGGTTDAFLLESAITFSHRDTWFGRIETGEKDELFDAGDPLAGETFRVDKLSLGYMREIASLSDVSVAVGVMGSLYDFDEELEDSYGESPKSFMLFLRAKL